MTESAQTGQAMAAPARISRRGRMSRAWRVLRKAPPTAWFGMIVIVLYLIAAIFAPLLAPYPETELVGGAFEPWGGAFVLGTDQLGRDMLSRLIYGARNSVGIAFMTTMLSFIIGSALGLTAAIIRGWIDQVLGRAIDVLMSIPQLVFALVLLSIVGSSIPNLVLIIAVLDSTRVFRLSRSVAQGVVVMDYVEAARLRGEKLPWIMR